MNNHGWFNSARGLNFVLGYVTVKGILILIGCACLDKHHRYGLDSLTWLNLNATKLRDPFNKLFVVKLNV